MSTKIVQLTAENLLRLKAVTIRPDGATTVIGGANGAGKSSVLSAIEMALAGANSIPAEPIRRGAESARIVLELDDLIVKRSFTASGSRLEVLSKDGATFKKPQELLDKLVGSLSFDPLAFMRMKPIDQVAMLRQLAGVDFAALDKQRDAAFAKRTEVTREVKRLGALLASTPAVTGAPPAEVSIKELAAELETRRAANRDKRQVEHLLEKKRAEAKAVADHIAKLESEIAGLEQKIEVLKGEVGHGKAQLQAMRESGKAFAAEVAALPEQDESAVVQQMAQAEATNAKARQVKARAAIADELGQAAAAEGHLTTEIKAVDESKRKLLEASKFNVPGLSFDDGGVRLNSLPFAQASSAEQLRASVAIGLAANPALKVLLIRDGSLLDENGLVAIAKLADDAGAQIWVEKVSSTGDGCSIVIEDGSVKDADFDQRKRDTETLAIASIAVTP